MTRNNLADHLSWLLRNAALSAPVGPPLPNIRDTLDSQTSGTSPLQDELLSGSSRPTPVPRTKVAPSSPPGPNPILSTDAERKHAGSSEVAARSRGMAR